MGLGLAIAGTALPVLQNGGNMLFQQQQNKLNRNFAEGQARLQRQYANEDFEKQNAYNAPAAQKQRLKDAGLNPNMMYGGSGGSTPSATVRGTAPADYKGIAPQSQINFQSLMQLPLMIEQTKQLRLLNHRKEMDNRMFDEASGYADDEEDAYSFYNEETGRTESYTPAAHLKNNPYKQAAELRDADIVNKKFQNDINAATSDSQKTLIIEKALIQTIQLKLDSETNDTKREMLSTALDNAKSEAKIKAAQAQLADMDIGLKDQYYLATLLKVLSLMK